jgi:hypothetical protein
MDNAITTEQAQTAQAIPALSGVANMSEQNGMVTMSAKARRKAEAAAKKAAELAAKLAPKPDPKPAASVDLAEMTPEQARALLNERKAKLGEGARKAWATRRANGFDAKAAARKAWDSRRAKTAALEALAAKVA